MAKMGEENRAMITSARQEEDEKPDRLSELPDALIHQIMSFLDIKTAIQTCVLSKRWNHLWVSLPDINIDSHSDTCSSFEKFVLKLLSSRADCSIGKFRINSHLGLGDSLFQKIIEYLMSHNVQHLKLCFGYVKFSVLSLFPLRSCNSLKAPRLRICRVDGSREAFRFGFGFTMLTSLNLTRCRFYCKSHDFNDLLASFPILKNLCLRDCAFYTSLGVWKISGNQLLNLEIENPDGKIEIFAPKLTSVYLKALAPWSFPSLELPSVDYVYIWIGGYDSIWKCSTLVVKEDYSLSLINFFRGLCNAQVVSLNSEIIEDLDYALYYVEHQPSPFKRLKSLKVESKEKPLVIPARVKTYLLGDNPHEQTIRVESSTETKTSGLKWKESKITTNSAVTLEPPSATVPQPYVAEAIVGTIFASSSRWLSYLPAETGGS